jgi:long-subunit fatty acid transport protein
MGRSKATYLNRSESDKKNALAFGTTGFVIGTGEHGQKKRNVAFSLAINRMADFNSNILYRGQNNKSSYSQKYLEEIANNNDRDANIVAGEPEMRTDINTNYHFGTSLAFNTFWIDTVAGGTSGNFDFKTRAPFNGGLLQEQVVENRGGITEIALGGAINTNDKLMLGVSVGIPILRYDRTSTFTEADASTNANNNFDYASVKESLNTKGAGMNLKAGLIFKPQEFWRIGLALHSPTVYALTDTYETEVTTNTEGYKGTLTDYSRDYNNGEPGITNYTLVTPYKAIASISYVLREIEDVTKQRGFLTADVEYVNYRSSSFSQDETEGGFGLIDRDYYSSLNRAIDNAYKGAFNFKAGGELKFTTIMVRLGAAFFGNPYKNINGEKGNKVNLSGGLGYRDKGFFVDLTYVHSIQKDIHFPYRLENRNLYSGANLKSNVGNVFLTVGKKF